MFRSPQREFCTLAALALVYERFGIALVSISKVYGLGVYCGIILIVPYSKEPSGLVLRIVGARGSGFMESRVLECWPSG